MSLLDVIVLALVYVLIHGLGLGLRCPDLGLVSPSLVFVLNFVVLVLILVSRKQILYLNLPFRQQYKATVIECMIQMKKNIFLHNSIMILMF